jgi:hypothetical protein
MIREDMRAVRFRRLSAETWELRGRNHVSLDVDTQHERKANFAAHADYDPLLGHLDRLGAGIDTDCR